MCGNFGQNRVKQSNEQGALLQMDASNQFSETLGPIQPNNIAQLTNESAPPARQSTN